MASAFAHIVVPAVTYAALKGKHFNIRLLVLAMALAIFPGIDVIAFKFGIAYESQWGHRGFTHSLMFAGLVALLCSIFWRQLRSHPMMIFVICFVACASHALLDAMTNGGLGVALYWPFDHERLFLPFRPIQVSPIGVKAFFSEWGLTVIASELIWVFIPGIAMSVAGFFVRTKYQSSYHD
jgi:inner membrane protein